MLALKSQDASFFSSQDQDSTVAAPVNPVFGAAVTRLIELHRQGYEFKLEASDVPFNALMKIREQLRAYGMSYAMAESMVEQIEDMFVHEAMDFTRKKKPTPLNIKMMVTDRHPAIDDDNKTVKIIAFDGMMKFGGGSGGIGMAHTINGTSTTEIDTPDFEEIFKMGRKDILVIYLEKDGNSTLNGMDNQVLAAAIVEAAGPAASPEALEELAAVIEAGEMTPETVALIETLAELNGLQAKAAEPQAPADIQTQITALQAQLAEQMKGVETIPPVLAEVAKANLESGDATILTAGSLNKPSLEIVTPQNDNVTSDSDANVIEEAVSKMSIAEITALAADMPLDFPAADKAALLEIVAAADLPESLRGKMAENIQAGEFTVEDFKVVEARIEKADGNPVLADMVQKIEAAARDFVVEVEKSIPPVALSEPLVEMVADALHSSSELPAPQKIELTNAVKQGPVAVSQTAAIVAALKDTKPALANAIVRQQTGQAVTMQAMKVAAMVPPSVEKSSPVAASVAKSLRAGQVPARVDLDKIKPALSAPHRKAMDVLNVLQDRKTTAAAARKDIKAEITALSQVLGEGSFKKESPLAEKAVRDFLQKHPNPSIQNFQEFYESLPEGGIKNAIQNGLNEVEAGMPKSVGLTGNNPAPVVRIIDDALRYVSPEQKAAFEQIREKIIAGENIPHEEFQEFYKALPETHKEALTGDAGGSLVEYKKPESVVKDKCITCPFSGNCSGQCGPSFGESGKDVRASLEGNRHDASQSFGQSELGSAFQAAHETRAGGTVSSSPNKSGFWNKVQRKFGL